MGCFISIAFQVFFRICHLGVRVNQEGLQLNCTHQILVYADDVNILGGSIRTLKKNTKDLVVTSKETGLEVNSDRTKYMVISKSECKTMSQYRLIIFPWK